jgi:peptidoglycan/LPS O-acetylase OafA/YrhL
LYVELIFYFWVFLVSFSGLIRRADKILGLWFAASLAIHFFGGITFTDLDLLLIPDWSFYFIAGGAFYLIRQHGPRLYLAALALASYAMTIKLSWQGLEPGDPLVACAFVTLFFLFFTAIAMHWSMPVEKPWMVTVGLLTYPLYLIHQNIGYLLLSAFQGILPRLWTLSVTVAIVLLCSYLIATQVERPFALLLKRGITRLLDLARSGGVELKVQAERP